MKRIFLFLVTHLAKISPVANGDIVTPAVPQGVLNALVQRYSRRN
jgi:hypothetical protein